MTTEPTPRPRRRRIRRFFVRAFYAILLLLTILVTYLWLTGARQAAIETGEPHMRAVVYTDYGSPEVLQVREIRKPVPSDDQILIQVRAASINPLEWHFVRGTPYIARLFGMGLRKPAEPRLGVDMAGVVEAVGRNVTQFKPGDEVFGGKTGALAEYVCMRADKAVVIKPENISFEQAAAVPVAGITALQGLRDQGKLERGQKVLINGASGGVGTFAVQVAKTFGADVTAVCSGRNAELVRSLGADHVIDYTKEDFTSGTERYDLILDNVGTQPLSKLRHALVANGRCILVGGGGVGDGGIIGPMARPLKAMFLAPFISQKMQMFIAQLTKADLTVLAEMMTARKVTPVIDRTYPLEQTPDAMRYLEEGHARGKVVITMKTATP